SCILSLSILPPLFETTTTISHRTSPLGSELLMVSETAGTCSPPSPGSFRRRTCRSQHCGIGGLNWLTLGVSTQRSETQEAFVSLSHTLDVPQPDCDTVSPRAWQTTSTGSP